MLVIADTSSASQHGLVTQSGNMDLVAQYPSLVTRSGNNELYSITICTLYEGSYCIVVRYNISVKPDAE